MSATTKRLGLVVRSGPWQGRSNREQLDFALSAAALGMELELVFMGHGLGQLLSGREADPEAGLPGGHKGWAALPGMTEVSVSAEEEAMEALLAAGHAFLLPVEAMDYSSLRARLDACDRVLVL